MSKRRGCLIALIGVPLLVIGAYKLIYPSYGWRQKTEIVVQTPTGLKSSSSSVNVKWTKGPKLLPNILAFQNTIEGEATVVDLGNGRYIFALLKDAPRLGLRVFGSDPLPDVTDALGPSIKKTYQAKGTQKPILPKHYPMLVTFTDINNPASVKLVDPNDLDASFGCSVDGSSTSNKPTNSSMPWRDAGLTWHAYQKQKAEKQFEAYYKRLSVFNAKIATLKKKFAALHRKTLARNVITKSTGPSRIIRSYNGPVNPTLNSRLYISSGYKSKIAAVRKQRVALMSSFESRREAISAAPNKGRSTAKDCYSIKSITLEIADEPVTTGKVESVLGIEFFKKWGSIHKAALKRGLKDPYFKNFMSDLGRGYFLRTSK